MDSPMTVRESTSASLSNSGSVLDEISTPLRIWNHSWVVMRGSWFTFAFFRRFGESLRHSAQPLSKSNDSKGIYSVRTYVSSPARRIGWRGLKAIFVQIWFASFARYCSQIGSSLFEWISNMYTLPSAPATAKVVDVYGDQAKSCKLVQRSNLIKHSLEEYQSIIRWMIELKIQTKIFHARFSLFHLQNTMQRYSDEKD